MSTERTSMSTGPTPSHRGEFWPPLPYEEWQDTAKTLHLWTQIVGKVRLTLTPWINHSWHVTLYVTSRGLTTSPIPYGFYTFEIEFDLIDHRLLHLEERWQQAGNRTARTVCGSVLRLHHARVGAAWTRS